MNLMNLSSPSKFLKKAAKIPPTFSMEHLLHRLYGVDAPVPRANLANVIHLFAQTNTDVQCEQNHEKCRTERSWKTHITALKLKQH